MRWRQAKLIEGEVEHFRTQALSTPLKAQFELYTEQREGTSGLGDASVQQVQDLHRPDRTWFAQRSRLRGLTTSIAQIAAVRGCPRRSRLHVARRTDHCSTKAKRAA
jgi:hypothetical protein